MRALLLLAAGMLLVACASGPAPVSPEAPEASRGSSAGATPAVTAHPATRPAPDAAVDGLLATARRLRAEGDIQGSLARLDRALRIAPQNAGVYLELARSHRAAGADSRASASAERGLLYCVGEMCRQLRGFIGS